MTKRDVANAFPSPEWGKLDEAVDMIFKEEGARAAMKARYRESMMRIRGGDDMTSRF